jgi:hypothetical protein
MTSGLFIAYWALICSHSGIWNFDMPWAKEALTLQLKPASCLIQNASLLKLITLLSVSVAKLAAPSMLFNNRSCSRNLPPSTVNACNKMSDAHCSGTKRYGAAGALIPGAGRPAVTRHVESWPWPDVCTTVSRRDQGLDVSSLFPRQLWAPSSFLVPFSGRIERRDPTPQTGIACVTCKPK